MPNGGCVSMPSSDQVTVSGIVVAPAVMAIVPVWTPIPASPGTTLTVRFADVVPEEGDTRSHDPLEVGTALQKSGPLVIDRRIVCAVVVLPMVLSGITVDANDSAVLSTAIFGPSSTAVYSMVPVSGGAPALVQCCSKSIAARVSLKLVATVSSRIVNLPPTTEQDVGPATSRYGPVAENEFVAPL